MYDNIANDATQAAAYESARRLGQQYGETLEQRQDRYRSVTLERVAPVEPEWFLEAVCGVTTTEPEPSRIRIASADEDDSYDADRSYDIALDGDREATDTVGMYAHAMGQISRECYCSNCVNWRIRELRDRADNG